MTTERIEELKKLCDAATDGCRYGPYTTTLLITPFDSGTRKYSSGTATESE